MKKLKQVMLIMLFSLILIDVIEPMDIWAEENIINEEIDDTVGNKDSFLEERDEINNENNNIINQEEREIIDINEEKEIDEISIANDESHENKLIFSFEKIDDEFEIPYKLSYEELLEFLPQNVMAQLQNGEYVDVSLIWHCMNNFDLDWESILFVAEIGGDYELHEELEAPTINVVIGRDTISLFSIDKNNIPSKKNNVYQIENSHQLRWFADLVNGVAIDENGNKLGKQGDANAELVNDIDLIEYSQWVAIGAQDYPYRGSFEGNGYKIYNVQDFKAPGTQLELGLFGQVGGGARINNLGIVCKDNHEIEDQYLHAGTGYPVVRFGILAGQVYDATISNCYVKGKINYADTLNEGMLIGRASGTTIISQCYSEGEINVNQSSQGATRTNVGGIVGAWGDADIIQNCYSNVTINIQKKKGTVYAGGIAGCAWGGTLKNCVYWGQIEGDAFINGMSSYEYRPTLHNCYYVDEIRENTTYGIPKSRDELKEKNTYENWDFNSIWAIDNKRNDGYPYLLRDENENSGLRKYTLDGYYVKINNDYIKFEYDCSIQKTENGETPISREELIKQNYPLRAYVKYQEDDVFYPVEFSWNIDNNFNSAVAGVYSIIGIPKYIDVFDYCPLEEVLNSLKNVNGKINVTLFGENIVEWARKTFNISRKLPFEDLGADPKIPYIWGGSTLEGFDCSGFVTYVFNNAAGVNISKDSITNCNQTIYIGNNIADAEIGDILFWKELNPGTRDGHVAIYAGKEGERHRILHSIYDKGVVESNLYYFYQDGKQYIDFTGIYRVVNASKSNRPYGTNGNEVVGFGALTTEIRTTNLDLIKFDANGSTVIPKDIFESALNNHVSLEITNESCIWIINADDILEPKEIDIAISVGQKNVPSKLLLDKNYLMSQEINLAYSGEFGFTGALKYYVGIGYSRKNVTLFYYDPILNVLREPIRSIVDEFGYATFTNFSHASSYVLIIENVPEMESLTSAVSNEIEPSITGSTYQKDADKQNESLPSSLYTQDTQGINYFEEIDEMDSWSYSESDDCENLQVGKETITENSDAKDGDSYISNNSEQSALGDVNKDNQIENVEQKQSEQGQTEQEDVVQTDKVLHISTKEFVIGCIICFSMFCCICGRCIGRSKKK